MRRRLDIAASIVVTPELMILDEPTTGLDPRSRNQVWSIIRALVGAGTTILLSTQHLEEADQLADGIAVIDHGKVIAEGIPSQLKASVGSATLHVRLLDPRQRPQAEELLERELGGVQLGPDPAALSVPCPSADLGAGAVTRLGGHGVAIAAFTLGQPSLDEVFLTLTGHVAHMADEGLADHLEEERKPCARSRRRPRSTVDADAVRRAISSTPRPTPVGPASTALTFACGGCSRSGTSPSSSST